MNCKEDNKTLQKVKAYCPSNALLPCHSNVTGLTKDIYIYVRIKTYIDNTLF